MKTKNIRFVTLPLLPMVLLASVATCCAQFGGGFGMSWSTLDGGGGPGAGSGFTLNGTIGQPDAGAMSGGGFTLTGGFWSGVAPAPVPKLSIRRGAGNTVILSWAEPSPGYVPEQTTNLTAGSGGWTDVTDPSVVVGPNREVMLSITGVGRWFRLRRL